MDICEFCKCSSCNCPIGYIESLRSRIRRLEKVAEAAHEHRVKAMLALHDSMDFLEPRVIKELCETDENLQRLLKSLKENKDA